MATTAVTRSQDEPAANRPGSAAPATGFRLPAALTDGGGRSVVLTWIVSRAIALSFLALFEGTVSGDATYYARNLHQLFTGGGVREVLQEYPLPVLGIMLPQYLIGALNSVAFSILFGLSMLLVDAAFTRAIWRFAAGRRCEALTFWLCFVPLVGPMAYFRFDIVTAVLAGGAVLASIRRPAVSGALTAVGAALKLWPALMLPIFLIRRVDRRAVFTSFVGVGVLIGVVSLLVGGFDRLVSPVRWQAARGLQVESVPAVPLMIGHALHPRGLWTVDISKYKSYDIFGSGVTFTVNLMTVATAVGLILLGWLWLRAHALPAVSAETLGWLFLATAAVITVTNKTLSPQYILWLGGPLAALLLFVPDDAVVRRTGRLLLVIALVTQVIYPTTYPNLLKVNGLTLVTTLVLAARNVLLVRLAWVACVQVWRLTVGQVEELSEQSAQRQQIAS